jgi:hypothetical protein
LSFEYEDREPFRRYTFLPSRSNNFADSCLLRIRIRNKGKTPALNCRCQILKIEKEGKTYGDYAGFPVRWSCKPENNHRRRWKMDKSLRHYKENRVPPCPTYFRYAAINQWHRYLHRQQNVRAYQF